MPLYVHFGDETLRDHVELSADEFYRRLRGAGAAPKTSQPTPADFEHAFHELEGYERVLCVLISGKLSGTVESARVAAQAVGGDRVTVIDSESVSGGTVILADAIQRRLDRGATAGEIEEVVARFKAESGLLFTVDTLDYLVRGGRVGKAAGFAGELLSVKPILAIREGEVLPQKRVRGRPKALAELERLFVEATEDSPDLHVGLAHADAAGEADELARRIEATRSHASIDFRAELGPVIGTHGGPGTIGLFWFRD